MTIVERVDTIIKKIEAKRTALEQSLAEALFSFQTLVLKASTSHVSIVLWVVIGDTKHGLLIRPNGLVSLSAVVPKTHTGWAWGNFISTKEAIKLWLSRPDGVCFLILTSPATQVEVFEGDLLR